MILHTDISDSELQSKIRNKQILVGGNKKLKIYGTLHCKSGKRMKRENRIFFRSENEAEENDYRPCGNCMKAAYIKWINKIHRESHRS